MNQRILIYLWCVINIPWPSYSFNLTILHNNDFHTHFESINGQNSQCNQNETCFGGIARTVAKANQIRKELNDKNMLFLNAGDNFAGTIWYTLEKGKVVSEFTKLMQFDVMTLGNHEFDDGLQELLPHIKNMVSNNVSIVCTNIVINGEGKHLVKPSIVVKRGDTNIAILGYTTPNTAFLSLTDKNVKFKDEIKSLRKEIENLKQKYGKSLNIFIAVGHSGFDIDKEIAAKVPDLDVVVGGHSNTFLYTGKPPSNEVPDGPYPVVLDHKDKGKTLVVQAYAYGKYLGKLDLSFDKKGVITHFDGNPILLDHNVKEDVEVLVKVKARAHKINAHYNHVLGSSLVDLDASKCQTQECSIGNVFTDAFVSYFARHLNLSKVHVKGWNSLPIAVYNGGSIRAGVGIGNITRKDIISSLSFGNNIGILKVKGSKLWDILQHSASQYNGGGFLQVSGLRYCFDSTQPIGQRLRSVRVRCAHCKTPTYEDLDRDKIYSVLMTEYLVNGGDNFIMIKGSQFNKYSTPDYQFIYPYIEKYSPIVTGIENRIINSKTDCSGLHNTKGKETDLKSEDKEKNYEFNYEFK